MTGALQAGVCLIAAPAPPRSMGRMRILSPCSEEMFAWVRRAADASLDIDLLDPQGRICVQMHGVVFPTETAGSSPAIAASWQFLRGTDAAIQAGTIDLGAVEKIELFLRQETALQLQKSLEEIRTDQSYFDMGLSSLAMAHLIQTTNQLLGENLLPSALFDFKNIDDLASYLAATFPAKIDALTVVRRAGSEIRSGERPHIPAANLTPFPRKPRLSIRPAVPSQAPEVELSREQVLEKILWQDGPLDHDYEKVAF
jgi:hypothetical protein